MGGLLGNAKLDVTCLLWYEEGWEGPEEYCASLSSRKEEVDHVKASLMLGQSYGFLVGYSIDEIFPCDILHCARS